MTAKEKFEARLKELGLYEDYNKCGDIVGKVMPDSTIVVLIHYRWDKDDPYTEVHYPSFAELWESEAFKKECMADFFENDDDKFVADLARWVQYGPKAGCPCPLFAQDVYFAGNGLETSVFEFEDDSIQADPTRLTKIIEELADMCGIDLAQSLHSKKIKK